MSTFKALSQLITVNDIYESFIGEFDNSQSVEDIREEWSIDLCAENMIHPMDQIALVNHNNKIIGWLGFEMLDSSKPLIECIEPINGDTLISSDTPLLEAIQTVCSGDNTIFLVLSGNKFIGFLHFDHFHKLPFRVCMFALLIDLERTMLEIIKSKASFYLKKLSDGRLVKAKNIYHI